MIVGVIASLVFSATLVWTRFLYVEGEISNASQKRELMNKTLNEKIDAQSEGMNDKIDGIYKTMDDKNAVTNDRITEIEVRRNERMDKLESKIENIHKDEKQNELK